MSVGAMTTEIGTVTHMSPELLQGDTVDAACCDMRSIEHHLVQVYELTAGALYIHVAVGEPWDASGVANFFSGLAFFSDVP